MNLQKLFEMQAKLDAHIEQEHPVQEGEDRLAKKILALQVELGELANCWRGFKFWSHDQEPRIKDYKQIKCKWCNGSGDDGTGICPDCKSSGDVYKEYNPLLEEYVDCLHFILSIGLELEITAIEIDSGYTHEDPSATFVELFGDAWELFNFRKIHDKLSKFIQIGIYERMFNRFIGIGEEHLGFTWDEIEQGYLEKNRINHERQLSNY